MKTYRVTAQVTTVLDPAVYPEAELLSEKQIESQAAQQMEFAITEMFLGGLVRDDENIDITVERIA